MLKNLWKLGFKLNFKFPHFWIELQIWTIFVDFHGFAWIKPIGAAVGSAGGPMGPNGAAVGPHVCPMGLPVTLLEAPGPAHK